MPDVWGFEVGPDGNPYMTEAALAARPERPDMSQADLLAEFGAIMKVADRSEPTEDRLDAVARIRESGMITDEQAEHLIRSIFEGRGVVRREGLEPPTC